jgi:hypothetical protein
MFLEHCESWLIKNLTREYIAAAERHVEERLSLEVLQKESYWGRPDGMTDQLAISLRMSIPSAP